MRVLIVEDEPKLAAVLAEYLARAQFDTHCLYDGTNVIEWTRTHQPDLIVLDLALPGADGIDICRDLRRFSSVPIVMTTARVEEIDRLLGLELGADDYICKPYSPREVVARIKAILRRVESVEPIYSQAVALTIDMEHFAVRLQDRLLDLTPVEVRLLAALHAVPGRVLSRAQLLNAIYDDHRIVTDRTVDSHIKNLRRKIATHLPGRDVIVSIYGVGYKLDL